MLGSYYVAIAVQHLLVLWLRILLVSNDRMGLMPFSRLYERQEVGRVFDNQHAVA